MALPRQILDTTGNVDVCDASRISFDSMTNLPIPSATQPYLIAGTGAPTLTAPKGSLYTNLTGSTTITRLYVNTDGAATWTPFTAGA